MELFLYKILLKVLSFINFNTAKLQYFIIITLLFINRKVLISCLTVIINYNSKKYWIKNCIDNFKIVDKKDKKSLNKIYR